MWIDSRCQRCRKFTAYACHIFRCMMIDMSECPVLLHEQPASRRSLQYLNFEYWFRIIALRAIWIVAKISLKTMAVISREIIELWEGGCSGMQRKYPFKSSQCLAARLQRLFRELDVRAYYALCSLCKIIFCERRGTECSRLYHDVFLIRPNSIVCSQMNNRSVNLFTPCEFVRLFNVSNVISGFSFVHCFSTVYILDAANCLIMMGN